MNPQHLVTAAEPATIIYLVTGAAGLFITRLRRRRNPAAEPVPTPAALLFCSRQTHEKLGEIRLT